MPEFKTFRFCFVAQLERLALTINNLQEQIIELNQFLDIPRDMKFNRQTKNFQSEITQLAIILSWEGRKIQLGTMSLDLAEILNKKYKLMQIERNLERSSIRSAKISFILRACLVEQVFIDNPDLQQSDLETPQKPCSLIVWTLNASHQLNHHLSSFKFEELESHKQSDWWDTEFQHIRPHMLKKEQVKKQKA